MNKKELVKTLMKRMEDFGYFPTFTNVKTFIKEYEKLAKSEPQKPVVPQFVADWYEKNKNNLDYNIWNYVYEWENQEEDEFRNWFNHSSEAFQTLINMHQFGYEIEEKSGTQLK